MTQITQIGSKKNLRHPRLKNNQKETCHRIESVSE